MLKNTMPSAAVIDSQSVKGGQLPALSCGYDAGKLEEFVQRMGRLSGLGASFGLGIIKRLEDQKGFIVLPGRWVTERSFGWLVKQRRLTRGNEKNPRHHEAFVYLAFIGIMTQRLTALKSVQPFAG